jgi:uncharacterized protein YbjT (DUF2867 family)
MQMSASIAGATGLVGGHCVAAFVARPEFEQVELLVRRPTPLLASQRRAVERVVDFEKLGENDAILRTTHVVCALGTTMKKAGSKEAFRRVDYDYPLAIARLALARGAEHYLLVSSTGANADSRFFYNRVKGELEDAILGLGFLSVTIVRPSLLVGEREELRPAESIGRYFLMLAPTRYRPVHGRQVAAALVSAALSNRPGCTILESEEIRQAPPL